MVQVSPQWRQRQSALSVMCFASVSMILPLQNGHAVGRVTGPSSDRDSTMGSYPKSFNELLRVRTVRVRL